MVHAEIFAAMERCNLCHDTSRSCQDVESYHYREGMAIDMEQGHSEDMTAKPKRPRDVSQRAKLIVAIATGQAEDEKPDEGKDKAAHALGRKGGNARAKKLTPEQRAEIARKAAAKRWSTKKTV